MNGRGERERPKEKEGGGARGASTPKNGVLLMPKEEFRELGVECVDWIAEYLAGVRSLPVEARVRPGAATGRLDASLPEEPRSMRLLLEDFRGEVLPGITHWNHPGFFGYFANSGTGPGILGELLAAALNVNAMTWSSSPAATELEALAIARLRGFLGLPGDFAGTINDTASISTFHALAAAREAGAPEAREEGLASAPPLCVYVSRDAHSSVAKACIALGLGRAGARRIRVRADRTMDPDALAAEIKRDRDASVRPIAVVATIGTTSTAASDPVEAIARIAARHNLWLHVDAAYAGPAASLPELSRCFTGWEQADSIVVNPHKWLFTPMDCSVLFTRRPATMRRAFSLTPAYLETGIQGAERLTDQGLALGRRFRSLKLWFAMAQLGGRGLRALLRGHIRLARRMASRVDQADDWRLWRPQGFSLAVFRWAPEGVGAQAANAANDGIIQRVNRSGRALISRTEAEGRVWIRFAVGNAATSEYDVDRAWRALRAAARKERATLPSPL